MKKPFHPALVRIAFFVVGVGPVSSRAWYEPGHRIINQLAIDSLPAGFPSWVREPAVQERIVFLSQEPDRWRRTRELLLQHDNAPDHVIDLDQIAWAGIDASALTPFRYEFVAEFLKGRAAHADRFPAIDPARDPDHSLGLPGFLPWAIAEYYAKLQTQFSYLKTYERYGNPDEIADARANVVYVMGVMGHFVGDGSQPLHTSIQYNGWVGPNPNGYTTAHQIHWQFEGPFVDANLREPEVRAKMTPPKAITGDMFDAYVAYLRHSKTYVEKVYQLEKAGGFTGAGSPESREFTAERLAAGASMLRDMIYTAWLESAKPVPDPNAGK
jgi:hypothetical protein